MSATKRPKRTSGVFVPHAPRWYEWVVAWVIVGLIRIVTVTLRYRWTDESQFFKIPSGPALHCVWHNRLVLSAKAYAYASKHNPTKGLVALVSASKDGGFLAAILECFGIQPVRGSSSRRGAQALLELTSWAERGHDLAITPDGPRGPRYVVQDGVTALAQVTGMPIVPWGINLGWKLQLKSWDRFQIPLPFSRCEMVIGKPVYVPREASDAEREALRRHLEATLKTIAKD
jgi:lysophospholipid acyltransferase (LPLAT)-like uncharacterized protein